MSKPNRPPPATGRTNMASCAVATIFLALVVIVVLIVFFTVFKPRDPQISVNAVQLPTFSVGTDGAVNFTFSQYVAVSNPNRASFSHYDSSLQLLRSGDRLGFMFIPAGEIAAGGTQHMAATFAVRSLPLAAAGGISGGLGYVEMETRMEMAGRVRVLHFFTHHVEARVGCMVAIAVTDGSVLGFHC